MSVAWLCLSRCVSRLRLSSTSVAFGCVWLLRVAFLVAFVVTFVALRRCNVGHRVVEVGQQPDWRQLSDVVGNVLAGLQSVTVAVEPVQVRISVRTEHLPVMRIG